MRRVSLAARRARRFFRRPPPPPWLRPALFAGISVVALSAGTALGVWAYQAQLWSRTGAMITAQVLDWTAEAGLMVSEVLVEGRKRTAATTLREALGIERGQPLLALDPAAAKARLEALRWVEQASVTRLLPGAVRVRLIERRPLALWQQGGQFRLIDQRGEVIEGALDGVDPTTHYGRLRVLVGAGAPAQARQLFALLSTEPALSRRVAAATWVGDRRWSLRLDNGIDVLLPERQPVAAWRLLAAKARSDGLLERAIVLIDLRLAPRRIRLRLDGDAFQAEDQRA
jgi:cell division protein FtsQ